MEENIALGGGAQAVAQAGSTVVGSRAVGTCLPQMLHSFLPLADPRLAGCGCRWPAARAHGAG
jgi:hypothetical protein